MQANSPFVSTDKSSYLGALGDIKLNVDTTWGRWTTMSKMLPGAAKLTMFRLAQAMDLQNRRNRSRFSASAASLSLMTTVRAETPNLEARSSRSRNFSLDPKKRPGAPRRSGACADCFCSSAHWRTAFLSYFLSWHPPSCQSLRPCCKSIAQFGLFSGCHRSKPEETKRDTAVAMDESSDSAPMYVRGLRTALTIAKLCAFALFSVSALDSLTQQLSRRFAFTSFVNRTQQRSGRIYALQVPSQLLT
jgi:hypothetical protein